MTLRVLNLTTSAPAAPVRFSGFPANKDDAWQPACGGTETPFKTRSGKTLHYLWNRSTGEHAYYSVTDDVFLTNEEAMEALGK